MTYSPADSTHPSNLIPSITYTPWGAEQTLEDGCVGSGCTNAVETYVYNNRMQPVMIELGNTSNASADNCLVYNYYAGAGNPTGCAVPAQGTGNNGNVMGYLYQDSVNPSLSHSAAYSYDSLNRLTQAMATGNSTYNFTFTYDRYGNMTCTINGQTQGPCPQYGFNSANNRITNSVFSYDAAGNLTSDATYTYRWDAEGQLSRMLQGSPVSSWEYNAFGQMVEKSSVIPHSYVHERLYDPEGLLNSYWGTSLGDWGYRIVWLGARRVGFDNEGSNESFEHVNNIGSISAITGYGGTPIADQQYYPWGSPWTSVNAMDALWASTTGSEGFEGLASTPNREYSLGLGRWMNPDPLGGDITNPQSLNRYAYVLNNPTTLTDPLGLFTPGSIPDSCSDPTYISAECPGPPGCVAEGSKGCIPPPIGFPVVVGGGAIVGGGGDGSTTTTTPPPPVLPAGPLNGPEIGAPPGFQSTAQTIEQIGVYASRWEIEVLSICAGTPVCQEVLSGAAVGGAAVGGGYLIYKGVQAGINIYKSRGKSDPVSGLKPVNPGRDANSRCKPCPSGPGPWEVPGNAHGSTTGTHWHWIEYNQNPQTCECFPVRRSGPMAP